MTKTTLFYRQNQMAAASLCSRRLSGGRVLATWVWIAAGALASIAIAQPPVSPTARPPVAVPPATNPVAKPPAAVPPGVTPVGPVGGKLQPQKKMQSLELTTKDNVKLRAFYFPSDKGKEAVPVVIVHEWQGQASPYQGLVKSLWDAGCAVIMPELRGHGGSREYEVDGRKKEFDLSRMSRPDIANIIKYDMETVNKFLRDENNASKLNLNALVLVGVREGAVIATQWAVGDLNFPSVGTKKQGQDVKALVLVSPEKILKGFLLDESLKDKYLWQLPFMIVVGQTSPQFADADRYYKRLELLKKRAGRGTAEGLQLETINTSLAGPALVNDAPDVTNKITMFIKTQIVDRADKIPWIERE